MDLFKKEKDKGIPLRQTPPEPPIKVLDYEKEEDKKEITDILYNYFFKRGITESNRILLIMAQPNFKPRITNLTASQISAIYSNYQRYVVKQSSPKAESPTSKDELDKQFENLNQSISGLTEKVAAQDQKLQEQDDIYKMIAEINQKIEDRESLQAQESETKEIPLSPELQEEDKKIKELQKLIDTRSQEVKLKTEQVKKTKQANELLKKLEEQKKALEKQSRKISKMEGEEDIEEDEESKIDTLHTDLFKILKECEVVMPRSVKNIITQIEGISNRDTIIAVLYKEGAK